MSDAEESVQAPIEEALGRLRLEGAIFFRSEFTEAWGYTSLSTEAAPMFRPGAERLIVFHIVANGSCWVSLVDGEPHWAAEGDVIVIPYGDQHRVGGVEEAECVPINTLLEPLPWDHLPVLRHGGGGERTDIICGYLYSEDPLFHPDLRAFPRVFVVRPPSGPAARWVRSSIEYALETSAAMTKPPSTRLPELLFVEILRLHLATAPAAEHGWIAASRDAVLAPALAELHASPERKWTVSELAESASVSRSLLDERFRQVLGRSPIRYLTEWRMHIAQELLASTDNGVAQIARRVGYDSEEAFSRAFKRRHGSSPTAWRAAASARARDAAS